MKRLVIFLLLAVPAWAACNDSHWKVEDRETINRTFHVAAGENVSKLLVDQLHGYIHVTGGSGSDIQVTIDKQICAESQSYIEDAKRDVKYEMTQESNSVKLYEDGPFRGNNNGDWWDGRRYNVIFDCEIKVPSGAAIDLKSLNYGIQVKSTSGDFKVHALNGKIDMQEIGGSGTADTLNGSVNVAFSRNPAHDSQFHTLNGSIDLYFHSTPDADLEFQTLHGEILSDFDVTTLPTTVSGQISGTRYVYRTDGHMKVRAGKGGPQLNLHTLNGSIRLHSKGI